MPFGPEYLERKSITMQLFSEKNMQVYFGKIVDQTEKFFKHIDTLDLTKSFDI